MLTFIEKSIAEAPIRSTVTLPFEVRQKSRFKTLLDSGEQCLVQLPRGGVLRHGDVLLSDTGDAAQVVSAKEHVSMVRFEKTIDFAKVCYHLGNRHVQLEIGDHWLRYLCDHVLDQLIQSMGFRVKQDYSRFEPESGAYQHA
ncbi:MAG: urease accessory protein UreE [Gammaproteobacteria bacterium]|nr:urease accessory protein UreE [Gammaproteobacteria bacterium]MDH5728213.1 urease accessory protein UreE [Gammaproteobacteria bacterium]